VSADDPVVLYEGIDYARAIALLIRFAHPGARIAMFGCGLNLPCDLRYRDDTDWMAAAAELAEAIGMRLHQITDVWVLAPRCGCTR